MFLANRIDLVIEKIKLTISKTKDQSSSLKVKQINWQGIGRNKQGKNMISIRKEMYQATGTLLQD